MFVNNLKGWKIMRSLQKGYLHARIMNLYLALQMDQSSSDCVVFIQNHHERPKRATQKTSQLCLGVNLNPEPHAEIVI